MRSLLTSLMLNEPINGLWSMACMAPRGRSSARAKEPETVEDEEVEDDAGESELLGIVELEESLEDVKKPPEVPAGMYLGEIQGVEKKTSAGKGNDYYSVKFLVPQEELPANIREDFEDGAVFYWNRQLVPKGKDRRTLYNLKVFIGAIGLDTNITAINPNEWMGCQAKLRIVMGSWQGAPRAEIRSVESAEAPARTQKTAGRGKR